MAVTPRATDLDEIEQREISVVFVLQTEVEWFETQKN